MFSFCFIQMLRKFQIQEEKYQDALLVAQPAMGPMKIVIIGCGAMG